MKNYFNISKHYLGEQIPENPYLLHAVYITPEEREKFNNVQFIAEDAKSKFWKKREKVSGCAVNKFFDAQFNDYANHTLHVWLSQEIVEYLQQEPDLLHDLSKLLCLLTNINTP